MSNYIKITWFDLHITGDKIIPIQNDIVYENAHRPDGYVLLCGYGYGTASWWADFSYLVDNGYDIRVVTLTTRSDTTVDFWITVKCYWIKP